MQNHKFAETKKKKKIKRNQAWQLNNENILELGKAPVRENQKQSHIIFILHEQRKRKIHVAEHYHHFFWHLLNALFLTISLIQTEAVLCKDNSVSSLSFKF